MTNSIVSIRIPKALVEDLRAVSERDHFMDLSEAVRSIVRSKMMSMKDPLSLRVEKLRQEILSNMNRSNQQALVAQLERIKEDILKKN